VIRVLIVDDHAVVRGGLQRLLAGVADFEVVGAVADGAAAVIAAEHFRPDVVIMDLSMPVLDGVEATRRLRAVTPAARVVVLTSTFDRGRIAEALEAGAVGFLLKDAEPDALVRRIRIAAGCADGQRAGT
jgi:DNA-binding NarL/FixJ family response regulator